MKKVSNSDYEKALYDKNNVLIMEKAVLSFRKCMTQDEIKECKLIALWDVLKSWNNGKKSKFTSFLYQKVKWECLKFIQKNKKRKHLNLIFDKSDRKNINIDEIVENLPNDLKDIIIKRYIYKMTLREISQIYSCCHETIRRRIKKATNILQK